MIIIGGSFSILPPLILIGFSFSTGGTGAGGGGGGVTAMTSGTSSTSGVGSERVSETLLSDVRTGGGLYDLFSG